MHIFLSFRSLSRFTLFYPGCVIDVCSCSQPGFPTFVLVSDGVQYGVDHWWLGWIIWADCVVLTPTHKHTCTPTGTFCCNEGFFFFMYSYQSVIKSLSIYPSSCSVLLFCLSFAYFCIKLALLKQKLPDTHQHTAPNQNKCLLLLFQGLFASLFVST